MNYEYRYGTIADLKELKNLAIVSWRQFQKKMTTDNWAMLFNNLSDNKTYIELFEKATCIVCSNKMGRIIGMAFLVPKGNPTAIYNKDWCYIRFVSVAPKWRGNGIGRQLTKKCIELAKGNEEKVIALHTSELMVKARYIYESLGFRIEKEIDRRFGKRYWLYKLDLI